MSKGKDAEQDEGFIGRWSRLKQAAQDAPAPAAPVPAAPDAAVPAVAPADAAAGDAGQATGQDAGQEPAQELPPIDSLDRDSDFTVFMKPGVPTALRNAALRKLWRSDPVFANLDGLLEYGDDFTAPWKNAGVVATAYQVGKGMVRAVADAADEGEPEPTRSVAERPADTTAPTPESESREESAASDSADANEDAGEAGAAIKRSPLSPS